MKPHLLFPILLLSVSLQLSAQVSVSTDNSSADPSAMLDVKSTNKGVVFPRMTQAQISAIQNPVDGLQVYNTTDGKLYIYVSLSHVWREVSYGSSIIYPPSSFACGSSFLDSRDGKSYGTVLIGTQCWMSQNLNVGLKINDNINPNNNGIIEKYCYNNIEINCNTYGGLYLWDEAMQYITTEGVTGICPMSWHIPSDIEWTMLADYLGSESVAGGKMKETGYAHWSSPNTGATNSSGLTVLGGGSGGNGGFSGLLLSAYFWSSTQNGTTSAWERTLYYSSSGVNRGIYNKVNGLSIRCLHN